MEDEDEIHSNTTESPSPSPPSPPPNGRSAMSLAITTCAGTSPPPPPQHHQSLALALPLKQTKSNGGGGGREDCWSEGATSVLIDAWGERYLELSRGNLKQKHWKEVAEIVTSREDYSKSAKTDIQCKNRIDTVKKKYKLEKSKIAAGGGPSSWPFFEPLDRLIGPTARLAGGIGGGGSTSGGGGGGGVSSKLPVEIPVRMRSGSRSARSATNQYQLRNQNPKFQFRKWGQDEDEQEGDEEEEDDEEEGEGMESDDSLPPEKKRRVVVERKLGGKVGKEKKEGGWGSSIRMLTQAMLKFGEAYEQAETAKLQQVVEMEKMRMKFAKELELQRMQFFMKTQMEISQLKNGRKAGNASNHLHHHHPHTGVSQLLAAAFAFMGKTGMDNLFFWFPDAAGVLLLCHPHDAAGFSAAGA